MFDPEFQERKKQLKMLAERKAGSDKAFADWLARPETKLILSTLPATGNPEALQVLLRSAFDAGCGEGTARTAAELVGVLLDAKRKGDL